MCKGPEKPVVQRKHSLLLSRESFDFSNEKTEEGQTHSPAPTTISTYMTIAFIAGLLCLVEVVANYVLAQYKDFHPLFESEHNRGVLARHFGIDLAALGTCAFIGIKNSHICGDVFSRAFGRSNSMPEAGYETRLFTYHPAAQQLLLVFFAYNTKNLYDTYIWGDGPEFIFHHVVSMAVAWCGMYPGCCHFYAIFFMGISEISTTILSLLASFDDDYGVVGLGDAFPLTKVILGVTFAIGFIICRATIWPYVSYFLVKDAKLAFKMKSEKLQGREKSLILIITVLMALTVLQAIWLVQIFVQGREEIMKLLEAK